MTLQTTQPMEQRLNDYYQALDRLKKGKPVRVPKGTKITNDAVSLEAGKQKGSIKKSRLVFTELIAAIDAAALEQSSSANEPQAKLAKAMAIAEQLRKDLDASHAREICLLYELFETKRRLAKLTGENVLPLRPSGSPGGCP